MKMTIEDLLQMVEEFLDKDLKAEKLSNKTQTKRKQLAAKVRDALEEQNKDKMEKFLEEQRLKTRYSLPDVSRPNLPLPRVPRPSSNGNDVIEEESGEELYMDLNSPSITSEDTISLSSTLAVTSPTTDGGSGSGYESYASDEDTAARNKYLKEIETLNKYFAGTNCDVYSFVYLENKSFLSGKKWLKRVGIVRENHFQCFKKLGDTNAVLNLPLSLYSAYLCSKDGTNSVIINLESSGSQGEGYRFYVEHNKADEWNRVLREKAASVVQTGSLPAPPVVSRPVNSLPPSERPINRQGSLGVVDQPPPQLAINDKPLRMNGDAPSSPPTPSSLNHLGKNLKNAVTDMFKKDKTKKKISVAEQLGADLCGGLTVYIDHKWSKKFCVIKNNELLIYGKEEAPEITLPLHGCDLHPYFEDPEKQFTFKLTEEGRDILFLSASNSEEMGKWIGKLIAETGCAEIPETPESIYVEPDLYLSVMHRAREVFNQTIRLKNQASMKPKKSAEETPDESGESLYMDLDISNAPASLLAKNRVKTEGKSPKPDMSRQVSNEAPLPVKAKPKRAPCPPGRKRVDSEVMSSPTQPPTRFNFNKKLESEIFDKKVVVKTHKKQNSKDLKQNGVESPGKTIEKNLPKIARKVAIESESQKSNETDVEKRLAEVNHKMDRLAVRKTELTKYLEASTTSKKKTEVEQILQDIESDSDRLIAEKLDIELEIRKKKNSSDSSINTAGNRRPQQGPRGSSNVTSPTGGNVLSRAKMFENLEAQK